MLKKHRVVMLPTNQKSNVYLNKYADDKNKADKLVFAGSITNGLNNTIEQLNLRGYEAQHLYFLSDEPIKKGDWFLMNDCIVRQCTLHKGDVLDTIGGLHHESVCKKIIATTDKIITATISQMQVNRQRVEIPVYLPNPSKQFIEVFIQEYNKGNKIEWVMVEYEDINKYFSSLEVIPPATSGVYQIGYKLKINPKDNTITIRPIKDSWTREEVIELLQNCWSDSVWNYLRDENYLTFSNWLEKENL